MTIGYSTKWPKSMGPEYAGKPNHFVEKIWSGLIHEIEDINISDYEKFSLQHWSTLGSDMSEYNDIYINPKYHTFRQDPKDRWKVGMKIHPVINNRTKNRFQFAPVLEVKAIQKIEIFDMNMESDVPTSYIVEKVFKGETYEKSFSVYVDDKFMNHKQIETLAVNDGFESIEQFFAWFNSDFSGKIIHWTNLKY